ncbi:hypothetical protein AB0D08_38325 [Kitasatospora sp. NPDC048540]|uniref:hypothetical protein n=1 Tax=Kitasatospora sp. NPDC048540 TaxID=3155634 RepID=UPI0033F9336D
MPATANTPAGRPAPAPAVVALLAGAAALTAAGIHWGPPGTRPAPAGTTTASAEQSGVQVTVVVSPDSVTATYRPERPGFHLYSITLPADGTDGLGTPTALDVQGGLHATGAPAADQPVQLLDLPGLDTAVPVYPDGPVTVTLPVTRTGPAAAQVVVSYAACSTRTCLFPVRDLVIHVTLH